jgi:hypothetical protein
MAGQHDQINIQAFSQAKYYGDNIASQDFSMSHYAFRVAASDGLFQVVRSLLLREVKDSLRG